MAATHDTDVGALRARLALLEQVCAEAYQLAGAVGAPVRVLDNLGAAANGHPVPHPSFLPVTAEECDEVAQVRAKLARLRAMTREALDVLD